MSPIFVGHTSAATRPTLGLGYRAALLSGDAGTQQTIRVMRQLVDAASADEQFVRSVVDIARSVPAYDDYGEVRALFTWVQRNVRYTKDPVTKEVLRPPTELMKIRAGDCDDVSMLLGAMLLAIGYPARLVTVATNPTNPAEFSHVYVEAEVPPGSGNWVALDVARPDAQFGLEPNAYYRKRAWSLMDDSYVDLSGCTRLSGLAGYARLGQSAADDALIAQSIQEIPAIMSVAQGGGSTVQNAQGTVATSPLNPYGSFVTPYTPGYGIPPAGYSLAVPASSSLWFSQNWPWLVGGLLALALFAGGRQQ